MSRNAKIGYSIMFCVGLVVLGMWWWHYRKLNVFLTTTLTWETTDRLILTGTTNLPNGTAIQIRFTAAKGTFSYTQDCQVMDGAFQSAPMLSAGQPPDFGDYTLIISMYDPMVQPASVQAVVGRKGQGLRGPYTAKFKGKMGKIVRSVYIQQQYRLESPVEHAVGELGKALGEGIVEIIDALQE